MPRTRASTCRALAGEARELAARLAELARQTRQALMRDLSDGNIVPERGASPRSPGTEAEDEPDHERLADTAAQTLVYGLYAAACYHAGPEPFTLQVAERALGPADPFVGQVLHLLKEDGRGPAAIRGPIQALLDLLRNLTDETVQAASVPGKHGRDRATHLYEDFLRAYNPRARGAHGVYYTPEPLVSFMVRSVDHLLKKHFGQEAGLAAPDVSILDPACGSGAFLCGVVDHLRAQFVERESADAWNAWAGEHLLPRLGGLEKLPAPHLVAQMNLGACLFGRGNEAARRDPPTIHLADALSDCESLLRRLPRLPARPQEKQPLTVVLGNPPYSGISDHRGRWIDDLLHGRLPGGKAGASYYHVDGKPLGEKKVWLQDDYVKFMRLGQWLIESAGAGALAFVTNHAWLDNPTFRGMRRSLMQTFTDVYVLDLHGNAKKRETCPDGSPDENVFDIQQGVAVGLFVKEPDGGGEARVHHVEMWGSRSHKFKRLEKTHVGRMRFKGLRPTRPYYFLVPRDEKLRAEYERGWKITEILPVYTTGIVTARDHFVTDFDQKTLLQRVAEFRSTRNSAAAIREKYFAGKGSLKYPPGDTRGWKLEQARRHVRQDKQWRQRVVPYLYRPFDTRPLYYVPWMVDWPRSDVMRHLQAGDNLALITVRQVAEGAFNHAFVTDTITDGRVTLSNKGIAYVFPLYLYGGSTARKDRRVNLSPDWVSQIRRRLGLAKAIRPLDTFHYIYAVLHSPNYRSRYAAFLQSDFPRIPLPDDRASFRRLSHLGRELCSLHLLQHPALDNPIVKFPVEGSNLVAPGHPKYVAPGQPDPYNPRHRPLARGRVYINRPDPKTNSPAQCFEGITPEMWNYRLCGYQPCRKWLTDRRRRTLTPADLAHYPRLATAIRHAHHVTAKTTVPPSRR